VWRDVAKAEAESREGQPSSLAKQLK